MRSNRLYGGMDARFPALANPARIFPARRRWSIAAVVCATALVPSFAAAAATNFVAFGGLNSTFRPSAITINVGDTVIWTNAGGPHTVTGSGTEPLCGGGQVSACTNTFLTPGSYAYVCNFHFLIGMTGLVEVVAAPGEEVVLTNTTWLTNGFLTFTILNTANQTNVIQSSTNLESTNNWVSIFTNVPETNRFDFTDTNASVSSMRFYRVMLP